ncbi:hypothetical protein [Saccharopolyspora griseoalba]|uniref:Integral membrane protein n=1 Tax=Saccharopolyspora griseoalba TaxID=1431848 RepID=A0ABW2LRB5_9PSEU
MGDEFRRRAVVWCACGAFAAALPTVVWRLLLAAGFELGTPAEWRAAQDIPGSGTWYVLGLSLVQLAAAACSFALVVDLRGLLPRRVPSAVRRAVPAAIATAALLGAVPLAVLVVMSVVARDAVDPFAGRPYGAWAWLSASAYLCAVLWPPLLASAAIAHLLGDRRAVPR